MQPGAGTTVERQVAGEFGDRSPVLKPNQTKPNPQGGPTACPASPDSSSSNMDNSSTNCNNTSVHGAHNEGGETAGRERWKQGRQANADEQGARTRPRGEDEGSSGAAAARTAGERSAATKEKPVDGSVNTGNTETEYIREQRREYC